jgi:hypothetical protein
VPKAGGLRGEDFACLGPRRTKTREAPEEAEGASRFGEPAPVSDYQEAAFSLDMGVFEGLEDDLGANPGGVPHGEGDPGQGGFLGFTGGVFASEGAHVQGFYHAVDFSKVRANIQRRFSGMRPC